MTLSTRGAILRFNAAYLGAAAGMGLVALDLRGILLGTGPEGHILASRPARPWGSSRRTGSL